MAAARRRDHPVPLLAYVAALEEELKKIQAFQRELPLSLDLVTRTIESFRLEMSEVDEETPVVMEEFIPMKAISGPEEAEKDQRSAGGEEAQDKADWLRSAQLWNQHQHQSEQSDDVMEVEAPVAAEAEGSDAGSDEGRGAAGGDRERGEQSTQKKERRCWSKDLHRKFLDAVQVLGGPEVATPKQVKELMNVDGLTNDEIKSHLQKHRIRSKRPAARATPLVENTVSCQSNQPQVLFGIWVPQGDYAAMAAAAAAAMASLPLEPKRKKRRKQKEANNSNNATGPVLQSQNATSTSGSNTTSA